MKAPTLSRGKKAGNTLLAFMMVFLLSSTVPFTSQAYASDDVPDATSSSGGESLGETQAPASDEEGLPDPSVPVSDSLTDTSDVAEDTHDAPDSTTPDAFSTSQSTDAITVNESTTALSQTDALPAPDEGMTAQSLVPQETYTDEQGISYKDSEKTKIKSVHPTGSTITIPASVIDIEPTAFNDCDGTLQSISVESGNTVYFAQDGVLYNQTSVFYVPKGIQGAVNVPEGITSAGVTGWRDRPGMTSVSFPSTLQRVIGAKSLFSGDTSLTSISVAEGNTQFKAQDGVLYGNGGTKALTTIPNLPETVTVPEGVTDMGTALANGTEKHLVLPRSMTTIGSSAFSNNFNLESVDIPDSVTSIGNSAFYCCRSLKDISIPTSVTSIGKNAFLGCTSFENISIPSGVTSIGNYAFSRCRSLEKISIPASVTSIGDCVFSGCTNLKEIELESGSTFTFKDGVLTDSSGRVLFETAYPDGRKVIIFPEGTTTATIPADEFISGASFGGCAYTVEKIISENSEYVVTEDGALYTANMATLIRVPVTYEGTFNVPSTVKEISPWAFTGCNKITAVVMPDGGVETIGYLALKDTSITSLTLPDSLWMNSKSTDFPSDTSQALVLFGNAKTLYQYLDQDANKTLTELNFDRYQQSFLPNYVFSQLYGLTTITLPKNVSELGLGTFFGCPNLNKVYSFNQNLQVATGGETGDPTLGWTSKTPSTFSLKNENNRFFTHTGMTFYGLNYDSNGLKAYADKYDCTFVPMAFLGNYDDPDAMANLVEGGTSSLNALTSSNTVSIANMEYTGEALNPQIVVTYSNNPAVESRQLVPGQDCTVTYTDKNGNELAGIIAPGTYTATITGDNKSVFGTATVRFKVTGDQVLDVPDLTVDDPWNTGTTASASFQGSNIEGAHTAVLTVTPISKDDEAYGKIMATMGTGDVAGLFEAYLTVDGEEVHDNFGTVTISFPVDAGFNGRTATVHHLHQDGTVTNESAVVRDGKVSVSVNELSSFGIEVAKTQQAHQAAGQVPGQQMYTAGAAASGGKLAQTGDDAGLYSQSLVLMAAAGIALTVFAARRRHMHGESDQS